jgi:hypothetical protein
MMSLWWIMPALAALLALIEYRVHLTECDGDHAAAQRHAWGWGAAYFASGTAEYFYLLI